MFTKILLALSLVYAMQAVQAEPLTSDEQGWIEAVSDVAVKADDNMKVKIKVYTESSGAESPLTASYRDGVCTVSISVRGNAVTTAVQDSSSNLSVARRAVAAHEYGHCVHRAALQAGDSSRVVSVKPEAFADAYAISWVHTFYPQHYRATVKFFRTLRERDHWGPYSTTDQVAETARTTPADALQGSVWEKTTQLLTDIK